MRMKWPLAITVLAALSFAGACGAQEEGAISVGSRVDRAVCTIGDLVTYTVEVIHADSLRVEMPGLGANLGGFEIRDYTVHDPRKKNGRVESVVDYVISTFFTGEFEIPPLTVRYFTPGDSVGRTLSTGAIRVTVESVKPSEAGDIRDIKPPLEIPRNWWLLVRWIALGLGFAGLMSAGVLLYLRRKAGKSLLPVREEPQRPPHETAREALDALTASDLLAKGEIKRFYTELSEIIRKYIGGRFFVVAMEMTTTEVLDGLSKYDMEPEVFSLFRDFLHACDLVKFAKYVPLEEEHAEAVRQAYDIVDRTAVVLSPEQGAQSADASGPEGQNRQPGEAPGPEGQTERAMELAGQEIEAPGNGIETAGPGKGARAAESPETAGKDPENARTGEGGAST